MLKLKTKIRRQKVKARKWEDVFKLVLDGSFRALRMHAPVSINLHEFTKIFPLKSALAMKQKLMMKSTGTFRNRFAKASKLILWIIMSWWSG